LSKIKPKEKALQFFFAKVLMNFRVKVTFYCLRLPRLLLFTTTTHSTHCLYLLSKEVIFFFRFYFHYTLLALFVKEKLLTYPQGVLLICF